MKFLLYGAYGYSGALIARMAKKYDLEPILAGRSEEKTKTLAAELGYDYRVFGLEDKGKMEAALAEVKVVMHAAGPFIHTARPMMEACLKTNTHYMDITGEIDVFELGASMNEQALSAKVMIMPGTGFDVVPTDCMAVYLKNKLPDASHLKLAFASIKGSVSHGTATTMVQSLGKMGTVRKEGALAAVPIGHKGMVVPFPGKNSFVMTIPWGDVSTAYYSTEIPNIETYTKVPASVYRSMKFQTLFNWLLRTNWIKKRMQKSVDKAPAGPSDENRERSFSLVWGEVTNESGEKRSANMTTPNGYTVTAAASCLILKKVLNGNAPVGFQTPAKAYGQDLVMEIEGVSRNDL